jgi:hypothetical protein
MNEIVKFELARLSFAVASCLVEEATGAMPVVF